MKGGTMTFQKLASINGFVRLHWALRLTIATPMLDIETEWTPSIPLPKLSALSASSQCRTPDR
jgi:hypothetical protein